MQRQRETFENINKQCSDFQKALADAKKITTNVRNSTGKILDGLKELSKLLGRGVDFCTICFEGRKQHATQCGHVICTECRARMEQRPPMRCFHCRTPVTHIFKIYL